MQKPGGVNVHLQDVTSKPNVQSPSTMMLLLQPRP